MDSSLFGRLSGELRNHIYEFALLESNADTETVDLEQGWFDCPFHRSKVMHSSRTGYIHPLEPLRMTGLPFTCKQIREESLRMYYSLNRFFFETEYLKSKHKDRIIERLQEWVHRIGPEQAWEIRDVTISLATLKGQHVPLFINWQHMKLIRSMFHPQGRIKVRFYLDGNGTATFTLGSRDSVLQQLDRMADTWQSTWMKVRRYSEAEARVVAERYKEEVVKLFSDMPDSI